MNKVKIPATYNYIGIFLSLSCNLSCSYCINHLVGLKKGRKLLNAKEWGMALGRLEMQKTIPITLQGGEPTIHKEFYEIINQIPEHLELDLLTNIQFEPSEFAKKISPARFNREAPYAPIRVSYHPETMNFEETKYKVRAMMDSGFKIGLFGVMHPDQAEEVLRAKKVCDEENIDFRTKEFLGMHNGVLHGTYAYPGAVFSKDLKSCLCKTSELLVDPFGDVFRCHHDLYNKLNVVGNLLDPSFELVDQHSPCQFFGRCNPCDVKVKNNYLQQPGHTSVNIIFN